MNPFCNWSHIPEHIDPTLFSIGPVQIRWYGILYLIAFLVGYLVVAYRIRSERLKYDIEKVRRCFLWAALGSLTGGRVAYVLLYEFKYFWANPLGIVLPFDASREFSYTGLSGLSYHGSLAGIVLVCVLFCYKNRMNAAHFGDIIISGAPLGYTLGRLGNFINGELYGRVTTSAWGMYFPLDPMHQLRHPSQLYEAFFEGVLLFVILWSLRKIKYFDGFLFCLYLIGYGLVRFFIEFVRQPDPQLGFIGPFTMGQILCLGMILTGIFIIVFKGRERTLITKQSC